MASSRSKEASLALLHGVFRPLSELAHILGLSVAEAEIALRYEFVRGALRRLSAERNRRVTFSDVAVVTGLHRRLVTQLLAMREPRSRRARPSVHRAARVLAAWYDDRDYRNADGRPRDLPIEGTNGFAELVRRYAGDVPTNSVLDELVRRGAVRQIKAGEWHVLGRAAGAADIDPVILDRATDQIVQLLRALVHNFSSTDPADQMFISDVEIPALSSSELPIARRDARASLEPALDSILRSRPKRYAKRGRARTHSASLKAMVCVSTATEQAPDPDKQPKQHRVRTQRGV